jgi:hypothetical protein
MYGGLARREEINLDGLLLVACHEIGHHMAGYPFKGSSWAATEGQSDYYATHVCAKHFWREEIEANHQAALEVDPYGKAKCDATWFTDESRGICYRAVNASMSLGRLMAKLSNIPEPQLDTPDTFEMPITMEGHPEPQCRLDTSFAGALCPLQVNDGSIPGRHNSAGQNSRPAELDAARFNCMSADSFVLAARPRCWFKPQATWLVDPLYDSWNPLPAPGAETKVVKTFMGRGSRSTERLELTFDSFNSYLEIRKGYSTMKGLRSGETADQETPFELVVSSDAPCGEEIKYKLTLRGTESGREEQLQNSFNVDCRTR